MSVAKQRGLINPFYVLVVLAGVAFAITATAYGVMTLGEIRRYTPGGHTGDHPLLAYLRTEGAELLMWQIAVLGVGTVGALLWDRWLGAPAEPPREPSGPS